MIAALEAEKEDNVKHVFVQLHFGGCAIIGEGKKLGFSHTFLSYPASKSGDMIDAGIDMANMKTNNIERMPKNASWDAWQ